MYEYKVGDLALMLSALIASCRDLGAADSASITVCTDEYCQQLALAVDGVGIMCRNFDADPSLLKQIETLHKDLKDQSADRREGVLRARLDTVIAGVQNNLDSRKFMYIPADQAVYWDNPELFGASFLLAFPPDAIKELREAGNCYAAARGTACVFHCMRVAEYGLRKLAKRLNAKITHKQKTCPIEYSNWDTVITAIRAKLAAIRQRQKGARGEQALQLYSSAADHCEYMKDIWRNELSHTRRRYNKAETLAVINRVREFVQLLAEDDAQKQIKKTGKKLGAVQQVRQHNASALERFARLAQGQAGSGEGSKKTEG